MDTILNSIDKDDIIVFTDGSVVESVKDGGAGIIIQWPGNKEDNILMAPCGKTCPSFKAEQTAIHTALTHIINNIVAPTNIWVFTINLGTPQHGPSSSNKVWEMLTQYKELTITMQWVPGHSDIEGNEKAAAAAKDASKMDQSRVPIDLMTAKSSIKIWMKEENKKEWKDISDKVQAGNVDDELRKNEHYVRCMAAYKRKIAGDLSRRDKVLIYQLKLGKCLIARSCLAIYNNKKGDNQLCKNGCVNINETVEHLLIDCPRYSKERCICFKDGYNITLNILNKDPKVVIRFLEMIGRNSSPELL